MGMQFRVRAHQAAFCGGNLPTRRHHLSSARTIGTASVSARMMPIGS